MSTSNPNTKTDAATDISINSYIKKAIEENSLAPKEQRTPSSKRKTTDQLSAEKTKPSKIKNNTENSENIYIEPKMITENTPPAKNAPARPKTTLWNSVRQCSLH